MDEATAPGPRASLAAVLADVHLAVARAATEADLLQAVVPAFARYGAHQVDLCMMTCDEHGAPRSIEIVMSWIAGAIVDDHPLYSVSIPILPDDISSLWLATPNDPFFIPDLDADPRVGPELRAMMPGVRGFGTLPLFSRSHGAWQGGFGLKWTEPHHPGGEELFVYRLLMQYVAAVIASRRTLRAHADALAETRALYEAQARLHEAPTAAALLAVVADLAQGHGATSACLGRLDSDADGRPAWLEVQATWGDAATEPGARFHLPNLSRRPQGGLAPQFVPDLEADLDVVYGVDEALDAARELARHLQARAVAVLPLHWRGRWTGTLVLGWPAPHDFDPGEQRMYTTLARQAAVCFDNRLLLDRAQAALQEHRQQRATLATLLDNLPVGVRVIDAASGDTLLANRPAAALTHDLGGAVHVGTDVPLPRHEWAATRALRTGDVVRADADVLAADGTRRTVEALVAPIRDDAGVITHAIGVYTDVTARKQAEAERLGMQAELIRIQAAALAERSTPLIPISDEVLVMPIIGTIDDERAQQITETLVGLGGHARVRVAIIDVTGVHGLDARAASALVGAAQALRLRGARPVLTGFPATSAALLAQLGADLGDIVVRGTLQDGIAYATANARKPGPRRPLLPPTNQ